MSRKSKQAVVWFRFKFADTAAGRMQVRLAADKLFRLPCVSERRSYTEEEVVGMVKEALLSAQAAATQGKPWTAAVRRTCRPPNGRPLTRWPEEVGAE